VRGVCRVRPLQSQGEKEAIGRTGLSWERVQAGDRAAAANGIAFLRHFLYFVLSHFSLRKRDGEKMAIAKGRI